MPFLRTNETDDEARQRIKDKVGDVGHYEVFGNKVLVGIYVSPPKTRGGIFLTEETKAEDVYQGKVGIVLKKGPSAFQDDGSFSFHGMAVDEGDWVVFRASDGFPMTINNEHGNVRLLDDVDVKMTTPRPDLVF
jgi:co-chaperonin GroES (HSP10)